MIVILNRSDGRGFVVWGRTRDERPFPKYTGSGCLFLRVLQVEWDRSVDICVVALKDNREPGLRYLTWLYCTGVIPAEACGRSLPPHFFTVQVLFSSRSASIAPPPPPPFF